MKKMTKSKRIIALLMALTLMVGLVPQFALNKAYAADPEGGQSASGQTESTLGGTAMTTAESLKDNGDGTFTLTLGIQGNNYKELNSTNKKVAQTGYFKAEADGNYLLELWGGNGGNGEKKSTAGGIGGNGGYVYGVFAMKKDDILFYTIGGNGVQTKKADEASANEGTGHGNIGSVIVGGGGGFSAIYYFSKASGDADTFAANYLNADGTTLARDTIIEQDRLTKYIMIAGGGGGGGAGQQWTIIPKCTGRPDGGTGGTMNKYAIDDEDNTTLEGGASNSIIMADGTVYVGKNGKSATADTKYVGRGATNDPGKEVRDFGLGIVHGDQPNDWTGTASKKVGPGGGGNGDMRGGGGGAGYAGGSGGLMAGLLEAWDVGGGGGGSSFVSNKVVTVLPDSTEKLLRVNNTSSAGGSVHITRLDEQSSDGVTKNPNYLNDMSLVLPEISQYFAAPTAADVTVSGETGGTTATASVSGRTITVSGFNMGANDGRKSAAPLTVSIKLTPTVVGGNGVNVFKDGASAKFTLTGYQSDDILEHAKPESMTQPISEDCSYVNVPFELKDFEVYDQAHNSEDSCTDAENNNHVQNLQGSGNSYVYLDDSAEFAANLKGGAHPNSDYDFITAFDGYTVKDDEGNTPDDPVSLSDTMGYNVTLSAVVSTAKIAKVGAKVGDDDGVVSITKHAIVSVLKAGEVELNDDIVRYKKTLTENGNGVYTLSLNIKSTVAHPQWVRYDDVPLTASNPVSSDTKNSASNDTGDIHPNQYWYNSTSTYTVPADGYYLVEACGGNGGNGGANGSVKGGTGVAGGYAGGIFKLTKGDVLNLTVGNAGSNGTNQSGTSYAHGGSGGSYSAVQLKDGNYLVIAGGGGGGSGAAGLTILAAKQGRDAAPAAPAVSGTVTSIDSNTNYIGTYNGDGQFRQAGTSGGKANGWDNVAQSGASVIDTSAKDSSVLNASGEVEYNKAMAADLKSYNGKGKVVVTPLQLDKVPVDVLTVKPYDEFSVDISEYFDIQSVTVTGAASYDTPTTTDNHLSVKNIKAVECGDYKDIASMDITPITIAIQLTPKAGFLGGNNVPVIKKDTSMALDQNNYTEKDKDGVPVDKDPSDTHAVISAQNATDFANVKIPDAALADYLTTYDRTITAGDAISGTDTGDAKIPYLYEVNSGMPDYYYTDAELDWQDDFVTVTKFDGDLKDSATATPAETTTYKYSYGIEPKFTGSDVKATVIGEVSGQTYDKSAIVTVLPKYYNVSYVNNTAQVTASGENRAQAGKDFTYTVTASGYETTKYKAVITITVDGTQVTSFESTGGELSIDAAQVTGDITVTTNLVETNPHYKVNINVIEPMLDDDEGTFLLDSNGNLQGATVDKSPSEDYPNATTFTVDDLFTMSGLSKDGITAMLEKNPGYHFEWQCDDASDEGIFATVDKAGHVDALSTLTIDGGDLWIYGVYVQDHYGVTVNYYKDGTATKVADSTVIAKASGYAAGQTLTVPVPSVSGWAADIASVSGAMPTPGDANVAGKFGKNTTYTFSETDGLTVNVFYKELTGALKIYYVKADTNEPFAATREQTITEGSSVNVESPTAPAGYHASKEAVTIASVTAEQVASGVTEYVYYIPNDVTVTFNANGGSDCDDIKVQYGSVYGAQSKWDGSTYTTVYEDLPTPVRSGYEFEGWYVGDKQITSDTTVDSTKTLISSNAITLTAKWTARTYNLTVRYVYGDNYEGKTVGSNVYNEEVIPLAKENGTNEDGSPKYEAYVAGKEFSVVCKDNVLDHYLDNVDSKTLSGVPITLISHSHTDGKLKLEGTMPVKQEDMRNQIIYVRYTPEKYTLTMKFDASNGAKTLMGDDVSMFPTNDMKLEYYYGQEYDFDVTKKTGDFYTKAVGTTDGTVLGKNVTDNLADLLDTYKTRGLTVSGNEIKGSTLTENTTVTVSFVAMEVGYVAVKITPHYDDQGYTIDHSNDKINFTIKADDTAVTAHSEGTDLAPAVTSVTGTNAITVFVKPGTAAKLTLTPSDVTAASPDGYASTDFEKGAASECDASDESIELAANAKFVPPVVTATVKHEINGLYANKTDKLPVTITLTLPTGAPTDNNATMKVNDTADSTFTFSSNTVTVTKTLADAEKIVFEKLPKNTVIKVDNTAPANYDRTVEDDVADGKPMEVNTTTTVKDENRVTPNLTGIADLMRGNLWLILVPLAGICAVVILSSAKRREKYLPKHAQRR